MTDREIKIFIRFLKENDFYVRYKKYFYNPQIGYSRRIRNYVNFHNVHKNCPKYVLYLNKYLQWIDIDKVFNAFWWVSNDFKFNCYKELSKLRDAWLIYLGKGKRTIW